MWFFLSVDKNTKEKRIVVRITAKNTRYERVSAVAVAVMGRGKRSTKDYEFLARWFKLRREKEEECFTAGPKALYPILRPRWPSGKVSTVWPKGFRFETDSTEDTSCTLQQRIPRLPLLDDFTPERGVRQ
ncbi:hypothetical protein AVEN_39490-1 [Araneus ventricosus]|uniref:Uncharacterized protein n=1 Tax=Araneus ventricosus TaxID=182803 RepID=A0A4Y2D7C8_ARAVE|nr:hypothetical protein AVEN_39490-1 [Araneus ventricosus]